MVHRAVPASVPSQQPVPGPPGPVRTCVGCRVRAARTELVRFVLEQGRVVPDPTHRMPGRGASMHPVPACLDLAERRRAFARALRAEGPVDLTAVRRYVEDRQHH